MSSGWRTVVVQGAMRVSCRDGQLLLSEMQQEEAECVPLNEISRVIVMSVNGSITNAAIRELSEHHISVVFCDKRYNPVAELASYHVSEKSAGAVMDQAAWTQERKDTVWAEIVRCKLANQIHLLEIRSAEVPPVLRACLKEVAPGDPTNREGQAARVYFRCLYGERFRRHAPDARNAALNYGYALLCSGISRALAVHGYTTVLGIHHDNRGNRFNLSCDLMEPFRPFVDRYVAEKRIRSFDKEMKKELILLLQESCIYAGRKMSIDTALEMFALDTVKLMSDGRREFRRVEFE